MVQQVSSEESLVGQTLGHYSVVERIDNGGQGVVYRARDEHLKHDVAIKVLPTGLLADDCAKQRFRKEALALSELNHPNIVVIHDFDTCNGIDYLVEEFVPGLSLDEMLVSGPLREQEFISLGVQLSKGLAAAHEHGIIHRDIKPSNIRITPEGHLKILDFGLAKSVFTPMLPANETPTLSETQAVVGTFPYMSPEQLRNGDLDSRTDIWSAGAVLYEMVTGRRAFPGSGATLIDRILHESLTSASELNHDVTPSIDAVIQKCLAKDPNDRYQFARDLLADLRRLRRQNGELSSGRTVLPAKRFQDWKELLGWKMLFAFGVAVSLVAVCYWLYHLLSPPKTPSIAVLPFADLSINHDQQYFSDGLAEEIVDKLTKVSNLKVVARTSAFQFQGKNEDLRAVGRKLNVENILEGSVRKENDHVRISAQLVTVKDGFHIWSESYERDLASVFTVQEDIADAVVSALKIQLISPNPEGLKDAYSPAPEAYQQLLQARFLARRVDRDSLQKALEHVTKAVQLDPNYAAAYAERAGLTLSMGTMAWIDYKNAVEQARLDLEKAITINPNLSDPYRVRSLLQSTAESNCPEAERTIRKALELSPGDADALGQSGWIAMCLGHSKEAADRLNQAIALDPLQPGRYLRLAQNLRDMGKFDEALRNIDRALEINPSMVWAHETKGEVYLAQNRLEESLAEMQKEPPGFLADTGMALAYHALGRTRESNSIVAGLIANCANDCAYQIAQIYAYRGAVDQAFVWLNRACDQHDGALMLVKTDLLLKHLRRDPRYTQILARLNLTS